MTFQILKPVAPKTPLETYREHAEKVEREANELKSLDSGNEVQINRKEIAARAFKRLAEGG